MGSGEEDDSAFEGGIMIESPEELEDRLKDMVERWRDAAAMSEIKDGPSDVCVYYRRCADDLEKLIGLIDIEWARPW